MFETDTATGALNSHIHARECEHGQLENQVVCSLSAILELSWVQAWLAIQFLCFWGTKGVSEAAVYLRVWEVLGVMMHPQNIDAHFSASWQPEPTQFYGFTGLPDLHFPMILEQDKTGT